MKRIILLVVILVSALVAVINYSPSSLAALDTIEMEDVSTPANISLTGNNGTVVADICPEGCHDESTPNDSTPEPRPVVIRTAGLVENPGLATPVDTEK